MVPYYVMSQPSSKAGTKMETQDILETEKGDLFTKMYIQITKRTQKKPVSRSVWERQSLPHRERGCRVFFKGPICKKGLFLSLTPNSSNTDAL